MAWVPLLGALAACADDDPPPPISDPRVPVDETTLCPVTQASVDETVVLVRDRGFDLKNKVFQGRIGGCYRIRCRPADQEQGGTFEQQKAALLAGLARKDDECHLEPGVTLTRDSAFEQVAGQRDAWNAAITAGTSPDAPGVEALVAGQGGFVYHGTAVAGLIAQHNPGVRLVLVSDESIMAPGDDPPCPTAAAVQRQIDLYEDPAVRAAVVAAPTSTLTDDLLKIVRTHRVSVNNESFGALPRASLEALCPGPWGRYFELVAELEAAHDEALAQAGAFEGVALLTLRAAGNEGLTLDTPADALGCNPGAPDPWGPASTTLTVGALATASWGLTSFSNRGACVDLYAPGQRIITWAPQDFLAVQSGTSFSSPLTARLAAGLPAGTAAQRRAAVEALLDDEKRLPKEQFLPEFFWQALTPSARLLAPRRGPLPSLRRRAFR